MNRAAWLQDRRMQKFRDVLSRWEAGRLSMLEAEELLGISERQFRRYRDRYEEDGPEGLVDQRLGKASPKRVPAAERERMLGLYRGLYRGWNVKHFHDHLRRDHDFRWGYTWAKTQLHTAGLVERARHRGAVGGLSPVCCRSAATFVRPSCTCGLSCGQKGGSAKSKTILRPGSAGRPD